MKRFGSGSPALKSRKAIVTRFWATSRSKIPGTSGVVGVTAREILSPAACVRSCDSHVTERLSDEHKARTCTSGMHMHSHRSPKRHMLHVGPLSAQRI